MKKIQQKKYTPTEIDLVGYKILFWFKIVKNMKHGLPNNVKGWWGCEKESLWLFEPFCKFWTLIKIKVSMTCVYKG